MNGSFGGRLGLVWESPRLSRDGGTYVVRVVQKGTRLTTPGPSLMSSAPEIGVVALVLWIPIRALGLLIFRNSFKVGLVEVDGHLDDERIVERHTSRGEKDAIALAKRLATQGEKTGTRGA